MPSHKRRWIIEEYEDSYSIKEQSTGRELYGISQFEVIYLLVADMGKITDLLKNKGIKKE